MKKNLRELLPILPFSEFISNKTDTFRVLLVNNTSLFSELISKNTDTLRELLPNIFSIMDSTGTKEAKMKVIYKLVNQCL